MEFISSDALIRSVEKTLRKLHINDEERPVAIQIYGKDTETMVEAAKMVEEANPDILDLNFGCPVKRVARKGAGAGMLQHVPKMLEMTGAVVKAVNLPVTVKTRLGWDDEHRIIVDLAERVPADDLSYRLGPCRRVDIHKACGHALGNILGTESPHVVLVSMGAGICYSLSHVPITPHMVAARTLRCVPQRTLPPGLSDSR